MSFVVVHPHRRPFIAYDYVCDTWIEWTPLKCARACGVNEDEANLHAYIVFTTHGTEERPSRIVIFPTTPRHAEFLEKGAT